MQVMWQDLRAEIGRDAEAAEDVFIREDWRCRQSLEAGQGQVAATEGVGVLLREGIAEGLIGRERWQVMIHVRAALDDRAAEQIPAGEAPEGVRGGEMRRDAETAG